VAIIIEMPKLSDTMSEGKILAWTKQEGDAVEAGEVLAEIESDKANMEMEAYDTGYLRRLLVPAGESAPVGAPIAIVTEEEDEDISDALSKTASEANEDPADAVPQAPQPSGKAIPATTDPVPGVPAPATAAKSSSPGPLAGAGGNGRRKVLASPLAFRMAAELGLDLQNIRGTGPEGRIIKRDILEANTGAVATPNREPQTAVGAQLDNLPPQTFEEVPHSSMRRIIGSRLLESKNSAPHYYVTVEVNMKRAIQAREELNQLIDTKITYNDLVVKAVALALGNHPGLNASWQDDSIRIFKSVDIGFAVALPDGLLTPVVRACHLKTLGMISREIKELVDRARQQKLTPDDYKGGTFTISNLGMFGVKHFTAIINPPEACILAVSAIDQVPVVENGSVVPGHRMSLTLSSDHRVVDGAQAAQFLRDLKQTLENPVSLAL